VIASRRILLTRPLQTACGLSRVLPPNHRSCRYLTLAHGRGEAGRWPDTDDTSIAHLSAGRNDRLREQQNEIQGNQENDPKQENEIKLEQNNMRDSLAKNQAKIADENVKKEGFYDKNDDTQVAKLCQPRPPVCTTPCNPWGFAPRGSSDAGAGFGVGFVQDRSEQGCTGLHRRP
jgi:hypothetical protein